MKYRTICIMFIIMSIGFFFTASSISSNHLLVAKFNLFINGYVSCNLQEPSETTPQVHCGGLDTVFLVYNSGEYIGYIDRNSYFIPVNAIKDFPYIQAMVDVVVLLVLKYIFIIISIIIVLLQTKRFVMKKESFSCKG